jgi:hypothetical protein
VVVVVVVVGGSSAVVVVAVEALLLGVCPVDNLLSSSSGLLRPQDGGHFLRSLLLWIQSVFFMLNKIRA